MLTALLATRIVLVNCLEPSKVVMRMGNQVDCEHLLLVRSTFNGLVCCFLLLFFFLHCLLALILFMIDSSYTILYQGVRMKPLDSMSHILRLYIFVHWFISLFFLDLLLLLQHLFSLFIFIGKNLCLRLCRNKLLLLQGLWLLNLLYNYLLLLLKLLFVIQIFCFLSSSQYCS